MADEQILLISTNQSYEKRLNKLISRQEINVVFCNTPEHGIFTVLNGNVSAVIIDTEDLKIESKEIISDLNSLDLPIEILLIADQSHYSTIPLKYLRSCFGLLSPGLRDQKDFLCVNRLIEKVTLRQQLKTLVDSSISDGLTGLLNHAFIQQTLEEEVNTAQKNGHRLSLIFLDIDHFKNFNDTNGHPEGDVVLKKVAHLIRSSVRKIDFAARYGGEEFTVLLPGTGIGTAIEIAERIRKAIATHRFKFGENQPLGFVSASLGVSSLENPHITTKKSLLFHADQALYCAKDKGRNQVWFAFDGKYQPFKKEASLENTP